MLQLYGFLVSQPVRAVEWLLRVKNVEHEFVELNTLNKAEITPDFLKMNPNGLVPVIKNGSFSLYEGAAIMIYLAEKHQWTDVFPTDLEQRAKVHQYLHWHHTNTRKGTTQVLLPFFHKATGAASPADLQFIEKKDEIIAQFTGVIEGLLVEAPYVAGTQQPTIADYLAYTELDQLETMGIFDFSKFPKVHAWLASMKKIPHHDDVHVAINGFLDSVGLKP